MVLFFESYNPIGIQRLATRSIPAKIQATANSIASSRSRLALAASSAAALEALDDMLTTSPA